MQQDHARKIHSEATLVNFIQRGHARKSRSLLTLRPSMTHILVLSSHKMNGGIGRFRAWRPNGSAAQTFGGSKPCARE